VACAGIAIETAHQKPTSTVSSPVISWVRQRFFDFL
jgi:hypothetical protein